MFETYSDEDLKDIVDTFFVLTKGMSDDEFERVIRAIIETRKLRVGHVTIKVSRSVGES